MQIQEKNQAGNSSLLARVKAEETEATKKARIETESRTAIAAAWDAIGFDAVQPWIVSGRTGIYGDKASLHFKEVSPDDLVKLMTAFPAIPRITYKEDSTRYFHPVGARKVPEGTEVRKCDGFELEISGGRSTDCDWENLNMNWSAMVGNIQTSFHVQIRPIHYLHPRTHRKAVTIAHTFMRYEGPASLVWPKEFVEQWEVIKLDSDLTEFRYGGTESSRGDFRIRGGDMLALAQAWEAEANRRNEATKAAFMAAYASVPAMPVEGEIAAKAETLRDSYTKENLRAGTLEQTAALKTDHALLDKSVAEKHWVAYAKHHGIETQQDYFDHYAWSCAYLKRVGFYEVPMGDGTYKYGHAWL